MENDIKSRYEAIRWTLSERMHRLWAATEAKVLGHGGVTALSGITGLSPIVIRRGIKELEAQAFPAPESGVQRIRKPGAGPKILTEKFPTLLAELESLVDPETRGDPVCTQMDDKEPADAGLRASGKGIYDQPHESGRASARAWIQPPGQR